MEEILEDIFALGKEVYDPIKMVKMSLLFLPKKCYQLTYIFFSFSLPPEVWKNTEGTGLGKS